MMTADEKLDAILAELTKMQETKASEKVQNRLDLLKGKLTECNDKLHAATDELTKRYYQGKIQGIELAIFLFTS